MRYLSFFIIYAISLGPIAALALFVADTSSEQIILSLTHVVNVLEELNASRY